MSEPIHVSEVRFTAARREDIERGLIGWTAFVLDEKLCLDGVAVRRTLEGRYALSFPARRDAGRHRHFYVRPFDDRARLDIERQVLGALGFLEEAPR